MYQLERSSTNSSNARVTFTVRNALVPRRRLGDELRRCARASQRSSGRSHGRRRRRTSGRKPSIVAYVTRNRAEFQSVSSFRLISCAWPKPKSRFRSGGCVAELPAHHVRAHPLERLAGLDRVPPRVVHLATGLVEHLLVAEHLPVRRRARQRDRHEELRVEPEPDLLAHLRDPVGREPLLPVGVVGRSAVVRPRAAPVA